MHRLGHVVCLFVVVSVSACSYFEQRPEPYRAPGVAGAAQSQSGRELYLRDCAWCHGNTGEGTDRGPGLVEGSNGPALVDFVLSTGRMPLDHPDQRVAAGDSLYSPTQIAEIVEFTETFAPEGPEIPDVDVADGDLARGLELYQENCAACHSTTGIGGALTTGRADAGEGLVAETSGVIAPDLQRANALQIAEAIRVGPGTMPVFGSETFTDDEVDSIVRYVLYLKDPADPGGAAIGRIGPVSEGAVAWVIGLGALLAFMRWIGTRRGEDA